MSYLLMAHKLLKALHRVRPTLNCWCLHSIPLSRPFQTRCVAFSSIGSHAKIYTRKGDKGTSVTIAGDRRPKDDEIFEALGATDELSSAIGLAMEYTLDSNIPVDHQLQEIQCLLQEAGSNIATPRHLATEKQLKVTAFGDSCTKTLEIWIDEYTEQLPPLRNFILPSGGKASASLHVARSMCRRAERRIAPLLHKDEIDPNVSKYFNRLSDYLFTVARYAAKYEGKTEVVYKKERRAPSRSKE